MAGRNNEGHVSQHSRLAIRDLSLAEGLDYNQGQSTLALTVSLPTAKAELGYHISAIQARYLPSICLSSLTLMTWPPRYSGVIRPVELVTRGEGGSTKLD